MMSTFVYLIFILIIVQVTAEKEKIDDVNYHGIDRVNGGIRFGEYPMVVPKRAALLLDRIMVALQKALEDEENPTSGKVVRPSLLINDQAYPEYDYDSGAPIEMAMMKDEHIPQARMSPRDVIEAAEGRQVQQKLMGLQRRGHGSTVHPKGRVWRCYFNAITCFKK